MTDSNEIDPEKKRLQDKYEDVDGERVRFLDGHIQDESVSVGDKLVRKPDGRIGVTEVLEPYQYDEYYRVVKVDYESLEITGSVE